MPPEVLSSLGSGTAPGEEGGRSEPRENGRVAEGCRNHAGVSEKLVCADRPDPGSLSGLTSGIDDIWFFTSSYNIGGIQSVSGKVEEDRNSETRVPKESRKVQRETAFQNFQTTSNAAVTCDLSA